VNTIPVNGRAYFSHRYAGNTVKDFKVTQPFKFMGL